MKAKESVDPITEKVKPRVFKNLAGRVYGRLTVLHYELKPVKCGRSTWRCECQCGNQCSVRASALQEGATRSCGCLNIECFVERVSTHGFRKLPEYGVWKAMIYRCTKPSHHAYANYGGRGITVCQEWMSSLEKFIEDMGKRPSSKHSIDRIDNNAGYCKENCRWAIFDQQCNNKRTNVVLLYRGEEKTLTQWARELGCNLFTLRGRVRRGWPVNNRLFFLPDGRRKA